MRTRNGKIARLPWAIREELNQRLLDSQPTQVIQDWLNGLDQVKQLLSQTPDRNRPGKSMSPIANENISNWKRGGFQDWLRRRERLESVRESSGRASALAKADNGSLSEGAAVLAAQKVLHLLETLTEQGADAETLKELVRMVRHLRAGDQGRMTADIEQGRMELEKAKVEIEKMKVAQRDEALRQGREKLELMKMRASELLRNETARRKAEENEKADFDNTAKITLMRKEYFADVEAIGPRADAALAEVDRRDEEYERKRAASLRPPVPPETPPQQEGAPRPGDDVEVVPTSEGAPQPEPPPQPKVSYPDNGVNCDPALLGKAFRPDEGTPSDRYKAAQRLRAASIVTYRERLNCQSS